jgi:hypothetical protein
MSGALEGMQIDILSRFIEFGKIAKFRYKSDFHTTLSGNIVGSWIFGR